MNTARDYSILSSRVVADQILFLRSQLNLETTTMQIIKLVYICHGWMLGIYNKKLMNEPVEAWLYGPVVPNVYRTFKAFRGDPIDVALQDFSAEFDAEQNLLVQDAVEKYKDFDGWSLSHITHRSGTPWDLVFNNGKGLGAIIPDKIIQAYYAKLAYQ